MLGLRWLALSGLLAASDLGCVFFTSTKNPEGHTAESAYGEARHCFYQLEDRECAYRLATLSYDLQPSEGALNLAGKAACLLGDRDRYQYFVQRATPAQRAFVERGCKLPDEDPTPLARPATGPRETAPTRAAQVASTPPPPPPAELPPLPLLSNPDRSATVTKFCEGRKADFEAEGGDPKWWSCKPSETKVPGVVAIVTPTFGDGKLALHMFVFAGGSSVVLEDIAYSDPSLGEWSSHETGLMVEKLKLGPGKRSAIVVRVDEKTSDGVMDEDSADYGGDHMSHYMETRKATTYFCFPATKWALQCSSPIVIMDRQWDLYPPPCAAKACGEAREENVRESSAKVSLPGDGTVSIERGGSKTTYRAPEAR